MKIIKPYAEVIDRDSFNSSFEFIEKIGRTCYKSEDHITKESAGKFVTRACASGHYSIVEHERLYFKMSRHECCRFTKSLRSCEAKFIEVTTPDDFPDKPFDVCIVSMNMRTALEMWEYNQSVRNREELKEVFELLIRAYPLLFKCYGACSTRVVDYNILLDSSGETHIGIGVEGLVYLFDSRKTFNLWLNQFAGTEYEWVDYILFRHLTHTVKFVCDRGISHELVRHRPCSFSQESTRYCNYTKGKFGGECTFIEPFFYEDDGAEYHTWKDQCQSAEQSYNKLMSLGSTPQEARSVLPNSLKTELVMTTTEEEWQHIVNLRYIGTAGSPHPQIKEVFGTVVKTLRKVSNGRIKYGKHQI